MLTKIFGRPRMTYRGTPHPQPPSVCAREGHKLMPRWRGPQVMEDETKAMGFVCHRCGREYLPPEVRNRQLIRGS